MKKSTFPAKHAFFFAPTQLKKHPKKVVEKKSFFYSEGLPQKTVPFSKKKIIYTPELPGSHKT